MIGDDVDDQAHAASVRRRRQPRQTLRAAEFGRHRRRVGDVVTVRRPADRSQDRRQVQMRHPKLVEIVQLPLSVGEGEPETARRTAQLDPVSGQYRKRHVLPRLTKHQQRPSG